MQTSEELGERATKGRMEKSTLLLLRQREGGKHGLSHRRHLRVLAQVVWVFFLKYSRFLLLSFLPNGQPVMDTRTMGGKSAPKERNGGGGGGGREGGVSISLSILSTTRADFSLLLLLPFCVGGSGEK